MSRFAEMEASPRGAEESQKASVQESTVKLNQCAISGKTAGLLEPRLVHHQSGHQPTPRDDVVHELGRGKVRLYRVAAVATWVNDMTEAKMAQKNQWVGFPHSVPLTGC